VGEKDIVLKGINSTGEEEGVRFSWRGVEIATEKGEGGDGEGFCKEKTQEEKNYLM